jgi:SARP family transcriptional regulator, regulator of embCAB operon
MHTSRGGAALVIEAAAAGPAAGGVPHAGGQTRLEIRTFGGLRVAVDGSPVPDAAWPAAARRLLELLLSLPGCRTTAPEAAQALWPNHPSRSARNSFNVALHGLRRALEPELTDGPRSRYVVREGRLYRLRLDRLTCDAEDLAQLVQQVPSPLDEAGARRLQAAADRCAGDFLASCTERFAEERRSQLRAALLAGLELLGRWYASTGRSDLAVPVLRRLAAQDPGRREAWERLVEVHDAGDGGEPLASTG